MFEAVRGMQWMVVDHEAREEAVLVHLKGGARLPCGGKDTGTAVRLVADHDQVLRPIQVTEPDRILEVYPTQPEALQRSPR